MRFDKLVLHNRREFVWKIFDEINHYIMANANAPRNNHKDLFGSLVDKNKSLLEGEKKFCKEKFLHKSFIIFFLLFFITIKQNFISFFKEKSPTTCRGLIIIRELSE